MQDSVQIIPPLPQSIRREAGNELMRRALAPAAFGIGAIYLFFSAAHLIALAPPARTPMAVIAGATGVVCLVLGTFLRRRPAEHPYPVVLGVASLALGNCAAHLILTQDPAASANFALVMVALGFVSLDFRWTLAAVALCFATWAVSVSFIPPEPVIQEVFTLLAAAGLGLFITLIRARMYGYLDGLRTEAEAKARQLAESEARYELALSGSNDGVYQWDLIRQDFKVSDRFLNLLGYEPHEVTEFALELSSRIHPEDEERVRTQLVAHLKGEEPLFEDEFRVQHKDGTYRWMLVRGASTRDEDSGKAVRMAGSVTDMSRRGVFDPLTGLPNRRLFVDRLTRVTVRRPEESDAEEAFAVLFLDLDGFKLINDTLGHQAGDELLKMVGQRLQSCVRASDTVARLGGDEFVVLLEKVKVPRGLQITLQRIVDKLGQPYEFGNRTVHVTPSIGVVIDTEQYGDPDEILRDADTAMYRAKESDDVYVIFDGEMRRSLALRLQLERELRVALAEEQFRLHFQPIVSLSDGSVEGYEALARWQHPTRGLVAPGEFIEVMEDAGLIIPLGHWVIKQACREMVKRFAGTSAIDMPYVSVNVSGKHLAQDDLVPTIEQALAETGFHPSRMRLEITESAIIENPRRAASQLGQLKLLGVQVLMDDFGTGHSSLSYLQNLPIDTLKIDRSFISRITRNTDGAELVRTIIRMAHNLGLGVVAEGIETSEQVALLQGMECASGQGYLFARPGSWEDPPPDSEERVRADEEAAPGPVEPVPALRAESHGAPSP